MRPALEDHAARMRQRNAMIRLTKADILPPRKVRPIPWGGIFLLARRWHMPISLPRRQDWPELNDMLKWACDLHAKKMQDSAF